MYFSEFYTVESVHNEEIERMLYENIKYTFSEGFHFTSNTLEFLFSYYLENWNIINILIILCFCLKIKQTLNTMIQEIEEIKVNLGYCLSTKNIQDNDVNLDSQSDEDSQSDDGEENEEDSDDGEESDDEELYFVPVSKKRKLMKFEQHDNKKNKCCHKSSIMKMLSDSSSESNIETEIETETKSCDNMIKQNNYIFSNLSNKSESSDSSKSSELSDSSDETEDTGKLNKYEPITPELAPINNIVTIYIGKNGKCFHTNINCIHLNKEKNTKVDIVEEYAKQFLCKTCQFSI
jgi:hypothetical protein